MRHDRDDLVCDPFAREIVEDLLRTNPRLSRERTLEHVSRKLHRPVDESLRRSVAIAMRDVRQVDKRRRNRLVGVFVLVFGLLMTVAAAAGLMVAWVNRDHHSTLEGSSPAAVALMVIALSVIVLVGVGLWAHALRSAITGADLPDWPVRAIRWVTGLSLRIGEEDQDDFAAIAERRRRRRSGRGDDPPGGPDSSPS